MEINKRTITALAGLGLAGLLSTNIIDSKPITEYVTNALRPIASEARESSVYGGSNWSSMQKSSAYSE